MTEDPGAQVRDALDAVGVAYEVMDCDPALADTAAFCAHYGVPVEQSANTILVAGKPRGGGEKTYVACVVLAHTRLDVNGAVRRRLDVKKASFASADETRELTGMLIGGVTAAALPDGMSLWVDARVMDTEWVVTLAVPGRPTSQVTLVTNDATAPVNAVVSIEVDDLDVVHQRVLDRGDVIVHERRLEAWGIERFFVRDPAGHVINVLRHRPGDD